MIIVRLKGGPGSGFHGHKGRPGKQGGSLPDDISNSIEYAPVGTERIEKYREEADQRISEWLSSGMSKLDIVRTGYRWRNFAHLHGDYGWDWAMWEKMQELASEIGYEYKNPLTISDVLNDPTLDSSLLEDIDESYHKANVTADKIITSRRNVNNERELHTFLNSELGKLYRTMSLRKLWGEVVANNQSEISPEGSFGADRHFKKYFPYPGMLRLLEAKNFNDALNTEVTIYRGIIEGVGDYVPNSKLVSFTTSKDIAKLFAEGFYHSYNKPNTGRIIEKNIKFGDILAYINPDNEYEIILPTEILSNVSKKESKIIKLKGGKGSGYFGHAGRPGKQGGSAPRNKIPEYSPENPMDYMNYLENSAPLRRKLISSIISKLNYDESEANVLADVMVDNLENFVKYSERFGLDFSLDLYEKLHEEQKSIERDFEAAKYRYRYDNTIVNSEGYKSTLVTVIPDGKNSVQLFGKNYIDAKNELEKYPIHVSAYNFQDVAVHEMISSVLTTANKLQEVDMLLRKGVLKSISYDPNDKRVPNAIAFEESMNIVFRDGNYVRDPDIFLHELGHSVKDFIVNKGFAIDRPWRESLSKSRVSSYAWTNDEEDFAETFCAYLSKDPKYVENKDMKNKFELLNYYMSEISKLPDM